MDGLSTSGAKALLWNWLYVVPEGTTHKPNNKVRLALRPRGTLRAENCAFIVSQPGPEILQLGV